MIGKTTSATSSSAIPLSSWLALLLLGLVWGSSYIIIKKGLEVYNPVQLACLRISISALAFLPIAIKRLNKVDWSKLRYLLVVGFAGSFIPAFLFAFAQTKISSSMTGVLSSLTPLFTLTTGILLFRAPMIWAKVLGVLVGLAGALLLLLFDNTSGASGTLVYGLLVVLASLLYSLSANTVSYYLREVPALTISAVSFGIIGIPATIFLGTSGFFTVLQTAPGAWTALGYICILALFGTVLASILFFRLVQITSAVFASMVSYLIPLVAVLWGLLDGEVISMYHFMGMALILTGVYLSRQ